jgi:hypothetical protein
VKSGNWPPLPQGPPASPPHLKMAALADGMLVEKYLFSREFQEVSTASWNSLLIHFTVYFLFCLLLFLTSPCTVDCINITRRCTYHAHH